MQIWLNSAGVLGQSTHEIVRREAFDAWFASNEEAIMAMLQLATRSLSLRLIRPSRVLEGELAVESTEEGDEGDTGADGTAGL